MITFEGVTKAFDDLVVLDDLSFQVQPSEKVSLIGPSGSGKTTILRTLMTLERPSAGRVLANGDVLWDAEQDRHLSRRRLNQRLRAARDGIGMVFQQFNLFPNMTALDNVAAPPQYVQGVQLDEARDAARQLLDDVGLGDKHVHYPHELSGGQQQRVAIARALSLQPKVLLLDEVTSALDPELVGEVLNVLRKLADTTSMTMLFVTHEMKFASEISDRVLMFDSGRIIEDRSSDEIFTDPQHERTRRFLKSLDEAR